MTLEHLFAGIPIADLDVARDWYERFAGRPPDLIPNDEEVCWQLAESGWIYVVRDPERAGHALLTLLVDDLDRFVAELAERGIDSGPIEEVVPGTRKGSVEDPDGNRLSFAEAR